MVELTNDRYIIENIKKTLPQKMVFIGGPRQVGKTTLSLHLLALQKKDKLKNKITDAYFNWDVKKSRQLLLSGQLETNSHLIIFDEIHKYARWRNLVKGFYDESQKSRSFIVTGSARLDYYRKGGDSLQGRYRYFRLHPYSANELKIKTVVEIKTLLKFGGFPEPLSKTSENELRLWQRDRLERIIYDDLRDLERVKEISLIEELAEVLPERIGSILSIGSLREDLQVSFETVERWITILERLYYCFRIMPYGTSRIRAVKKEKKLYLWDWSVASDEGKKFENLVASQLLKYCHYIEDTQGYRMELRFIRDTDKREIDFVVLKDKKPEFAVECKYGEKNISPHLKYFSERIPVIPKFYQVHLGEKDYEDLSGRMRVLPFLTFCKELDLP